MNNFVISTTDKGRCVISGRNYAINDLVEETNVIVLPKENLINIDLTILEKYYFEWFDGNGALLTGNGLLYNHWSDPNLKLVADREKLKMKFLAKKPIQRGDELVFDYGYIIENAIKPISKYFETITH